MIQLPADIERADACLPPAIREAAANRDHATLVAAVTGPEGERYASLLEAQVEALRGAVLGHLQLVTEGLYALESARTHARWVTEVRRTDRLAAARVRREPRDELAAIRKFTERRDDGQ